MTINSPQLIPGLEYPAAEGARFVELRPQAWPDSKRIKVHVTLTCQHPALNLQAVMVNSQQEKVSEVELIGLPGQKFVFTMHLKEQNPGGLYRLVARLYSRENPCIDEKEISFELH